MENQTPNDALEPQEDPEPTVVDPGASVPSVEEWKKRAAGWQRTAQEHQKASNEWQQKHASTLQEADDLRAKLNEAELQLANINTAKEDLQGKLTAADQSVADQQAAMERLNTLLDYPDLLPMRDMLRQDLTGTEFKEYLDNFSGTLSAMQTKKDNETLQGSTPPGGGEKQTSGMSADQIYDRLMAGDVSEAERLSLTQMLSSTLAGPSTTR